MDVSQLELVDSFLDHLKFERRLSPHTVKSYRRDLDCGYPHIQLRAIDAISIVLLILVCSRVLRHGISCAYITCGTSPPRATLPVLALAVSNEGYRERAVF
jgi:site-specific recombinase XerC